MPGPHADHGRVSVTQHATRGESPTFPSVQHIVVPLDLSDEAHRALEPAQRLSRALRAPITLFGWHWDPGHVVSMRRHMARLASELHLTGTVVATTTEDISPARSIAEAAHARTGSIVVMATHARSRLGALALGSVAEEVVGLTHQPVVLVGPHAEPAPLDGAPVVACLDGSPLAEAGLPVAVRLAHDLDVPLALVSSVPPSRAPGRSDVLDLGALSVDVVEEGYLARLARAHGATNWSVVHGDDPAATLIDHTRHGATLLVAATHGRSGLARAVIGSVAIRLVHGATCPVLLVRPRPQG